ncbi:MAG TPA: aldo/keto reductase [Anaerolineaceae bacterium]|nr:aldo/keto reductase [Anaerolineaceae bacterium]HQN42640.1 aldo/keto reductase [Anaerolineaceae bacterium]
MSEEKYNRHPIMEGLELGLGTWAWGDRLFWGYGQGYGSEDTRQAFDASIAAGVRFFDTAEVYGQGQSELILGKLLKTTDQPLRVATKFMPFPWQLSRRVLLRHLRASLKRLDLWKVSLYQMHFPNPPVSVETWMEAMAEAVHNGLTEAVGVSNYDRSQMQRAFDTLARQGISLASNQVEYHLLDRRIETSGMLQQCRELGVTVIAYSPLAQGMLTGKYTAENPPRGFRAGKYTRKTLAAIKPLVDTLKKIGSDHAGKTAAQVALNWTICKGTVPIPGAKNLAQAEQNAGAMGWRLTDEEVARLDELSERVTKAD